MEIKKLSAPSSEDEIKKHWKYTDKVYISCVCITFNQKDYIRDAIDSFLAQETEYRFEIIIHDDVSTDGARDILLEYKDKYPSLIKLVLQDENQYKLGKKITPLAVEHADGEYIALCEGDDFWIDKNKLQKQIQIFIDNRNISLVHTCTLDLKQSSGNIIRSNIPSNNNTTINLCKVNRIRTLTAMFRKSLFESFYEENINEVQKWLLGDWPLWIFLSIKGEVKYIKDITSVYRILEESASHSKSKKLTERFKRSTIIMRFYMISKYKITFIKTELYFEVIKYIIKNADFKLLIEIIGLKSRIIV